MAGWNQNLHGGQRSNAAHVGRRYRTRTLRISTEPATSLAVSPDGKTLFAGGAESGSVRKLDAKTGRLVRQLPVFKKTTIGLFLTADGKRLIVAGADDEAQANLSVAFVTPARERSNGNWAASIFHWNKWPSPRTAEPLPHRTPDSKLCCGMRQGKKVAEQVGHGQRKPSWVKKQTTYQIGSLALSANGRWLAYSDQEEGIVLVDARSGREVGRAKVDVFYQAPSSPRGGT